MSFAFTRDPWTLILYPLLLPFWGATEPLHHVSHIRYQAHLEMKLYHPLAVMWLNCMTNYTTQEENVKTFLPTFRLGSNGTETNDSVPHRKKYRATNYSLHDFVGKNSASPTSSRSV